MPKSHARGAMRPSVPLELAHWSRSLCQWRWRSGNRCARTTWRTRRSRGRIHTRRSATVPASERNTLGKPQILCLGAVLIPIFHGTDKVQSVDMWSRRRLLVDYATGAFPMCVDWELGLRLAPGFAPEPARFCVAAQLSSSSVLTMRAVALFFLVPHAKRYSAALYIARH